jgi:hypothetical protein
MKNHLLRVFFFALIASAITSCATMHIDYSGKKVNKVQSIALVSTFIGKLEQPIFPLIDAGIFNGKTNSISEQIMDNQRSLRKNFNCSVLYSDSLHSLKNYIDLKEKNNFRNSLRIDNEHFPIVVAASNDINPFRFENGNVLKFFAKSENCKTTISMLAKELNTDLIAVSYSNLSVLGVGIFGMDGYLRLDTHLFLFDKEGDLITHAHTWSKQTNITGKKINEYKIQLATLSSILGPMMKKVILNFQ